MVATFSPELLPEAALQLIAARFKALSEPLRLKLIVALHAGEKNVTDLVNATGTSQANVSRQLRQLTDAGILSRRKKANCVYYSISDPAIFELCHHVCGSLYRQFVEQGEVSALFTPVPSRR